MRDDRFSDEDYASAWNMRWRARSLTGCNRVYPPRELLSVPPEWTALLLMKKAGVPDTLIEHTSVIGGKLLKKRLRVTTLLMIYPPYAARIEQMMRRMPEFETGRQAVAGGQEATCAQTG